MNGPLEPSDFWAKLHPDWPDVEEWHPLAAHSAEVAAVTEALLTRTILRDRLAALVDWDGLSDVHVQRLCVLAALHDAGKVNHGFQEQAFPGSGRSPGHVQPIVNVLEADLEWQEKLLLPLGMADVMEWFESPREATHFLLATWGHHGRPVEARAHLSPEQWEKKGDRDPTAELRRLGSAVRAWFPAAFESAPAFPADRSAFQHAFNGALTLADWIGSGFPFLEKGDGDPLDRARGIAGERLSRQALLPAAFQRRLDGHEGFEGILDSDDTPYDVQKKCVGRSVHRNGSLTVLESDTGSGKTEAAVARFFRLYREGQVDGMYFAVPTRSAAQQLYERIDDIVEDVYSGRGTPPPVVQAVPGYFKVDGVEGTPVSPFETRWHDEVEEDAERERRWAAEHPKKFLAGAIVVGTIDQALLSALQVRHAHMRAAALLRHFLVVDEVHASDVYMTRLLEAVLGHHLQADGHALLMSATLGTASRMQLVKSEAQRDDVPPLAEAEESGYPLVTHVSAARQSPASKETEPSGYEKTVTMTPRSIADDPAAIAKRAVDAARDGARVLVIRNVVKDCLAVQEAVEEEAAGERELLLRMDDTPVPHHSRYASGDRQRLDAAIETAFGKETPIRGVVAVATQTVQQSLDLSASLQITDLCPVDVLLQRIGRLHRHGRAHPPGFEEAECVVLLPEERDLSSAIVEGGEEDGRGLGGPHGLGTVYADLRVIAATRKLVEEDDAWTIPDDNRRLVERGTHPDVLRRITEERTEEHGDPWARHARWVFAERAAMTHASENVLVERHRNFGDQQFGDDLTFVKTRLGQDDVRIEFSNPQPGPFDAPGEPSIEALSIPEHQIFGHDVKGEVPDDLEPQAVEAEDDGFRFAVEGEPFRYDWRGLQKHNT
jgi:CRISPR-associated endonuclease/helicase Cas3